jgi:uncharacterized protein (TIGR02594 family)
MAEDKSTPKGANKYSVYAQRDVESTQVNYADAAATLTKSFTDVRDDRKKRKEELEDSFDTTMSVLDQVEDMQTQTAGEKITQASQMSVDSLVRQNQLMKNGEISVRDYQRFEGRLKAGYANVNKVVKNWDKWQGETNTRMTEGKSGYLEIGNAQDVQPLGQFSDHELVTNPATGNLAYAVLTPDGKLPTDPAAFIPPSKVYSSMKYRQNKYNVTEAVEGTVGSVATIITAAQAQYEKDGSGASITSLEDFRQLGDIGESGLDYEGWMNAQVAAIVNDTTAGQILVDRAGYGAAPTLEEFQKRFPGLPTNKWIPYTTKDGTITANYSIGQKKMAEQIVRDMIESGIDSKTTKTAGSSPRVESATQAALRLQNEAKLVDLQIVNDIAAGDLGAYLSSGSQGIIGVNKRLKESGVKSDDALIDSITRQGDEIIVEYQSGRTATPIKRKNADGSFRTTEEIGKEIYQLISADGKSFVNDLKTAQDSGFKFGENVRDKTEAEVESMLEINKAKEYLIGQGVTNPTPAQITEAIENEEIDQITQAELTEAMESGVIPQVYAGEDAVQYASREDLKTKNIGDNITKSVGAKLNDTTGADYIKQKYNSAENEDDTNLTTNSSFWMGGPKDRAKALQGPMQTTLSSYLPRKLKGKVKMTLTNDGKIKVNYGDKDLDITGVTDITLGQNETFEKLDAITNQIAQDVTARYNLVLQSREGGSPTPAEVAATPPPPPGTNAGNVLFEQVTTEDPQPASVTEETVTEEAVVPEEAVTEEVVTEEVVPEVIEETELVIDDPANQAAMDKAIAANERQEIKDDSIRQAANFVPPAGGPSQQAASTPDSVPSGTGMGVNNNNPLSEEDFNKLEKEIQESLSAISAEKASVARDAEVAVLAKSLYNSDNPDVFLQTLIKYDTSLTNNPLIFAEKYLGVSENNPEQQETVQGFLNDAVPGYAENPEDVTKDEMAWCAAFMNNILNQGSLDTLNYGNDRYNLIRAKQYSEIGEPVASIESASPGDIIVTQQDGQFHVGLYAGTKNGKNLLLGGNQGNRVSVKEINNDSIYSVRRINTIGKVEEEDLQRIINTQYYDELKSTGNTTR